MDDVYDLLVELSKFASELVDIYVAYDNFAFEYGRQVFILLWETIDHFDYLKYVTIGIKRGHHI